MTTKKQIDITSSVYYEDLQTGLQVRSVAISDLNILTNWFSSPKVMENYGGPGKVMSKEQVKAKFFPLDQQSRVKACIIQSKGRPIGYIQIYVLDTNEKQEYGYPENLTIFATDQFIADTSERGKGLGTALIRSTINYIVNSFNPERITLDPQVVNEIAIHVYEKCGFRKVKLLPSHEKYIHLDGTVEMRDSLLMEYIP